MNAETERASPWWMRLIVGRKPQRTLLRMLVLVSVSVVVFKFVLLPIEIKGISMEPTYFDGRVNFVNRLAYKWHKPQRGDVVAVSVPNVGVLLKRIVALPGERVELRAGKVLINGKVLEEPYVRLRGRITRSEIKLEPDHYFVIGDNRSDTYFEQVPVWTILGKVVL